MKSVNPILNLVVQVGLFGLIIYGFTLVTQSGQEGAFQNDGYAVSGGLLIAIGSSALTWWMLVFGGKKKK